MTYAFQDGYVTFLDVLGFTALIEDAENTGTENLASLLDGIQNYFENHWEQYDKSRNLKGAEALEKTSTEIIWVSDSIIISGLSCTNDPCLPLYIQGVITITIAQALLKRGYLLRGGTAYGKVLQHKIGTTENIQRMLFGSAYMKALEIEKNAVYPIIKMDEISSHNISTQSAMVIPSYNESIIDPEKGSLCWDILSDYYLSPFSGVVDGADQNKKIHSEYKIIYDKITTNLIRFENMPRPLKKWEYLAEYFNKKIATFPFEDLLIKIQ